jgi:Lar family restriction alleviation protein
MSSSKVIPIRRGEFTEAEHGRPIPGTTKPAPCPFCGRADLIQVFAEADDDGEAYYAGCQHCGAEGPTVGSYFAAAQAWNYRPDVAPISRPE